MKKNFIVEVLLFRPLKMGWNYKIGCVLVFSTQNQVPQVIIGMIRVIVILNRFSRGLYKNKKIVPVLRKTGYNFDF